MRVLITGAAGFIGQNFSRYLMEKGHEVIGVYHNKKPGQKLTESYMLDLQKDNLQECLNTTGELDAVIHLAGQMKGARIQDYLDNTVCTTRNLISYAEKKSINSFVYASSIAVYGETEGAVNENSSRVNLDDYGMTKYICERLLEDSNIKRKIIIRLPRTLGKNCDLSYPWLPKVAEQMYKNEEINYRNPQLYYNNLAYVDDVSAFILKLLSEPGAGLERYVLGGRDKCKIIRILDILKSSMNSTSLLTEKPAAGKNKCFQIDTAWAEKNGFVSRPSEEILKQFAKDVIEGMGNDK